MTKIDHVVFDIGRVLLHWEVDLIYMELIPDPDEREHFLTHVCSPDWNLEQDRGRDWRRAEDVLIKYHPDKTELIRAFRKNWIKSVPYAYEDVVEIFQSIIDMKKDVTLLTNFNQDTYIEAQNHYGFLNQARGETVSGRVNLLKPDPAIYHHHSEKFALTPERTLFIDDSPRNVEEAISCGWNAIHFAGLEGAAKLKESLAKYQL